MATQFSPLANECLVPSVVRNNLVPNKLNTEYTLKFRDQPISSVTSGDENKYHGLSEGQLMRFIYIHGDVLVFRLLLFGYLRFSLHCDAIAVTIRYFSCVEPIVCYNALTL